MFDLVTQSNKTPPAISAVHSFPPKRLPVPFPAPFPPTSRNPSPPLQTQIHIPTNQNHPKPILHKYLPTNTYSSLPPLHPQSPQPALHLAARRVLTHSQPNSSFPPHIPIPPYAPMQLASITPPATLPFPHPPRPAFVEHDLHKAFQLLQRHPTVRDFMLDASSTSHDVALLTTPRPSFTIFTEEEQHGALPGRIALRYLGIPAFSDCAGLSGGAVVTSYTDRTHPLHAPTVMADVRVGRYIRDNHTGEWCILTRNPRDGIIRLQYIRVNKLVTRERICLTCSSDLFDAGHFLASVLFQCHDQEWRPCPFCGAPPSVTCACAVQPAVATMSKGLAAVAETVAREGRSRWVGKVRVTVISGSSHNNLVDIDECMDVRASYQPSLDSALAADMQRLAIFETANTATVIPTPIAAPPLTVSPAVPGIEPAPPPAVQTQEFGGDPNADGSLTTSSSEDFFEEITKPVAADPLLTDNLFPDSKYDFHILESAIMPADPSTLPGGTDLCMDGMDLEEDWCSFISNDKNIDVTSSASAGSDGTAPSQETAFTHDTDDVNPQRSMSAAMPSTSDAQVAAVQALFQNKVFAQPAESTFPENAHSSQTLHQEPKKRREMPKFMDMEAEQSRLRSQQAARPFSGPVVQGMHLQPAAAQPVPMRANDRPAVAPITTPIRIPKKEEVLLTDFKDVPDVKPNLGSRGARLAPRPAGMSACADGFIWQMGNAYAIAAHLEAVEKERKAEERRKKNRQAAARSNARKKSVMDAFKAEIKQGNVRIAELREQERVLREENFELRRRIEMSQ